MKTAIIKATQAQVQVIKINSDKTANVRAVYPVEAFEFEDAPRTVTFIKHDVPLNELTLSAGHPHASRKYANVQIKVGTTNFHSYVTTPTLRK